MSIHIIKNGELEKVAGSVHTDAALNKNSTNPIQNKIVTEKFEEMDRALVTKSYDADTDITYNDNISNGGLSFYTRNGVHHLSFSITNKGTQKISWGTTILSLPIGCAPWCNMYLPLKVLNGSRETTYGMVLTNGNLYVESINPGEYLIGTISF